MNIFIDCGAYTGKILKEYLIKHPSFKGYAFECSPALKEVDYGEGVEAIRKAIWSKDTTLPFFMNHRVRTIQGNSFYKNKTTGDLDKNHPVAIECIDFSKWLSDNFDEEDFVVVKMNIEGAEYDVLEKCIDDGTMGLINELHIQWHNKKIPGIENRHHEVIEKLALFKTFIFNGYSQLKA